MAEFDKQPILIPETPDKEITQISATEITQEAIDAGLAKSLVVSTFNFYSNWRTTNHDPRWISHDSLYFGFVPTKVWTGTNIPRANLPMSLVFAKVESALPSIMQSLFYSGGNYFQVQAESAADKEAATMWQDVISYVLEHPNGKFGNTVLNEFSQVIKEILLYGNGGIRLEWNPSTRLPEIETVDIRDFYIDPATPSPSVDSARSLIERRMVPVDVVHGWMQADKRFKQMSLLELQAESTVTPLATQDTTRRLQEAFRAVDFDPGYYNWIPNPADRSIEVLIYHSATKIVYVINRRVTIYNEANPYGFVGFNFAPCFPVPGRFYAQSIADVTEGFQRYTEALMNGHLDEVSLAIHPPRQISKDSQLSPGNQKWYPGSTMLTDSTQSKNTLLQPASALTNVMGDIQMMGSFSDMVSGINGVGMGVPRPGNANRTATGIDAQSNGNTMRLLPIVLAFEYYLFVPMLYKIYEMIRRHTPAGGTISALNKDKEVYQVPGSIITKKVNFKMMASTRMLTQQQLQQLVPFLMQGMFQGPFLQGLNQANQTVDFTELMKMLQDAAGTEKMYQLIRPLNEQELQAKNAPPPGAAEETQKATQDAQVRLEMGRAKNEAAVQVAQIKAQPAPPDPSEAEAKLQDMQMKQMESAEKLRTNQQTAQLQMALQQQKLEFERQMNDAKIAGKQQELAAKAQATQYEQAMKREGASLDLDIKRQQGATMVEQGQQKASMDRTAGMQQLSLKQMAADAKLKNEKARKKPKKE